MIQVAVGRWIIKVEVLAAAASVQPVQRPRKQFDRSAIRGGRGGREGVTGDWLCSPVAIPDKFCIEEVELAL